MSARARILLLGALSLGAVLVLFLLLSNPGGGRGASPDRPVVRTQVAAERAAEPTREAELAPIAEPRRLDQTELQGTTVLWPLRVDLDLVEADYLPREDGMAPLGSGADAALAGYVHDAQDEGVAATLTFRAGPNTGRVLHADGEGRLGASDLLPGLSIVDVRTASGSTARRELRLRRGKETPFHLTFAAPGVVTGHVTDPDGNAIEGAAVRVDGTKVYTDAEGGFFAGRVASGQVLVEIEHPDFAAYQELVWVASAQVAPHTDLSFTLRPGATLRVAITSDVGGPGPVQLLLLPGNATHRPPQEAYRNARFPFHRLNPVEVWPGTPKEVAGLPADVVQVLAFRPGAEPKQAVVNLRGGRPYDLKLQLEAAPTLVGRVLADGEPVVGATVRLEAPDVVRATLGFLRQSSSFLESAALPVFPVARQQVVTDEQGRFRLSAGEALAPTRYLEARGPRDSGWAGRLVHRGEREVDLVLGPPVARAGEVELELPGRWQGLPVEAFVDGAPRGDQLLPPSEDLVMGDLLAGRYRLRVSWHGEVLDDVELSVRPTASRRLDLPAACIDGQDEEDWRRAGRDYPRVP